MAQDAGIKNSTRTTGTVAGNAATKVPTTNRVGRRGVMIHNPNATYDLWGYSVGAGASAPTISATDRDFVVPQDATLFYPLSDGEDLYLMNSSGGATTSEYILKEVDYAIPTGQAGKIEATLSGTVDTELTTADLDTGAGTDTRAVVGIVVAASGGAVAMTGGAGAVSGGTPRVTLASDDPAVAHLANIVSPYRKVDVDLTVDTAIYASGDVLADLQAVSGVCRASDVMTMLVAARLQDPDDQTEFDFDLVFSDAAGTLGTENAAVSISDADAAEILNIVRYRVASNPSIDLINSKSYTISANHPDMPLPISPVSGTDDVMIGAILRSGTPTFAGGVLKLRLYMKDR